jgi:hypothetical protein
METKTRYRSFFCVMTEIYGNGTMKAAVTGSRPCVKKPLNSYREFPGMTAYKDWFETREQAEAYLRERGIV